MGLRTPLLLFDPENLDPISSGGGGMGISLRLRGWRRKKDMCGLAGAEGGGCGLAGKKDMCGLAGRGGRRKGDMWAQGLVRWRCGCSRGGLLRSGGYDNRIRGGEAVGGRGEEMKEERDLRVGRKKKILARDGEARTPLWFFWLSPYPLSIVSFFFFFFFRGLALKRKIYAPPHRRWAPRSGSA